MKEIDRSKVARRERLKILIDEHGSAAALAKALNFKSQSRISHMMGEKGMGEKAARDMETALNLQKGWLDGEVPEARKPIDGNVDLLAECLMAVLGDSTGAKLKAEKQKRIAVLLYTTAAADGYVMNPTQLRELIDLAR